MYHLSAKMKLHIAFENRCMHEDEEYIETYVYEM